MKKLNWRKYAFDFLSIFIAVIAAFALNNWNDNRKDNIAEAKILKEIVNWLNKDIEDIQGNMRGHRTGLKACNFWRALICNPQAKHDSVGQHYFNLTRDFVSIQNNSGYESLKSKGLEIIDDDSLRFEIISLYEYNFHTLKKLEEEYDEMQFNSSHFKELNNIISKNFFFNEDGQIIGIDLPMVLSNEEENKFLSHLWKIQVNRNFILGFYTDIEKRIEKIIVRIKEY